MSEQQGQSFLDKKTVMAVLVTMGVWIGWQWYMQKKYPDHFKPKDAVEANQTAETKAPQSANPAEAPAVKSNKNDEIGQSVPAEEKTIVHESAKWAVQISTRGMALKEVRLKEFTDREGEPVRIGGEVGGRLSLETGIIGNTKSLIFTVEKSGDHQFIGRANVDGLNIVKTLQFDPESYRIESRIHVSGESNAFTGLATYLVEPLSHLSGASMFAPQTEFEELFVEGVEEEKRIHVLEDTEENVAMNKVKIVALGTQYFTQAVLDQSDVIPELKAQVSGQQKSAVAALQYPVLKRGADFDLKFTAFFGPKSLELLRKIDPSFVSIVDFGFFSSLGRPILKMLKWFYGVVGNWGVAIILLTVLVRFLVLPFNVMSFRSMQAMQAIQPQVKALREKFKNDPNRLNQETMALFKTHKVNPLGGCLPVLLQIPIFIALYQVLGHSIELYQAPFALWIHDLSLKDPYYVLPVLMGVTMFLQMKLTPSAVDPVQAKVMMFMPLIFTVFMLALPSGLTLYIFVSTLFAIVQQIYLKKSSAKLATNT